MPGETSSHENISIRSVAYPGRGVGKLADGMVVFVPGVLPDETARVEVLNRHTSYAEASLIAIIDPDPGRQAPVCPLAATGACPGCVYQHADYSLELTIKQAQLEELLSRLGGIAADIYQPPVAAPSPLSYRNKIQLHVGRNENGVTLGYAGHDNHTIEDVPRCPLAVEPINALLQSMREDEAFIRSLQPGETVTFRHTHHDGALCWRQGEATGPAQLKEDSRLGPVVAPRRGFYQVNPAIADAVIGAVQDAVQQIEPRTVIDAYCGIGMFSLAALAAGARETFGIDSDAHAIRAARRNAQARGYNTQTQFAVSRAFDGLRTIPAHVRPEATLVILDPPRAGLEQDVRRLLAKVRPGHIVYVSCAADTLARTVQSARLFDMFPRTPYFETVVQLHAS